MEYFTDELKAYRGITPKPEDFDEYWSRALAELDATEPCAELRTAEFYHPGLDLFDLYFNGTCGARIHAKLILPKDRSKKLPAVLPFHVYSGSSGLWLTNMCYAAAGYVVAMMDVRGQAGESQDSVAVSGSLHHGHVMRGIEGDAEKLFYRNVMLDAAQLARVVMDMDFVDETRVSTIGGSQGGGLAIACAALEPRISKLSPINPFLSDYMTAYRQGGGPAYEEMLVWFRQFDPHHKRLDEVFNKLGYVDVQNLACRVKAEVRQFTGLRDFICPPKAQAAVFNKFPSKKEIVIFPDYGHEQMANVTEMQFEFIVGAQPQKECKQC